MSSVTTTKINYNIIVKKTKYKDLEAQIHVYQKVHELSKTCNLFVTPELLGYDLEAGSMDFECLPAFQSLAEHLENSNQEQLIIEQVAKSLAYVHQHGRLDTDYIRYAPGTWRGCSKNCVLIHGDFNLINVGYDAQENRVIILDWEITPALNIYFNMGSRYLDISCFLRNLLLQQQSLCKGVVEFYQRASLFLDTYQKACNLRLSLGTLWYYLNMLGQATQSKQWDQHKWVSLGQNVSGKMILSCFMKTYKTNSQLPVNDRKGE